MYFRPLGDEYFHGMMHVESLLCNDVDKKGHVANPLLCEGVCSWHRRWGWLSWRTSAVGRWDGELNEVNFWASRI